MTAIFLTTLTMIAFALNSILNRAAVDAGAIDPATFAVLRVVFGVLTLAVLVTLRKGAWELRGSKRWGGAGALALYMIGFSLAYQSLDAGIGALILFGTVQIALFLHAAIVAERPTMVQFIGATIAFAGLSLALWPGGSQTGSILGAGLMVAAGLGWAGYTVAGRGAANPLAVTASHFLLCLPLVSPLLFFTTAWPSAHGVLLAAISGAITSGLGYALWYHVLPSLTGARAGIVQLSVPIIAILLGAVLLGEALTWEISLAAGLVLGGILIALTSRRG